MLPAGTAGDAATQAQGGISGAHAIPLAAQPSSVIGYPGQTAPVGPVTPRLHIHKAAAVAINILKPRKCLSDCVMI